MSRPIDIIRKVCPHAHASYVVAFENGDALFRKNGITTPLRLAHFLAQCLHETGGLTIEWESGNYTAARLIQIFGVGHHSARVTEAEAQKLAHNGPAIFERVYGLGNPHKAHELGNTQPGDGFRYRGGGIMQTTGRANYRRMGQKCGVDFEAAPELVLSGQHALKPALAEWTEGNLNAAADRDDILTITKKINGGTNGLESRREWFSRVRPLIKTVELVDQVQPAPAPAPPPPTDLDYNKNGFPSPAGSPSSGNGKNIAAGGVVIAGTVAAQQAHSHSHSKAEIGGIVVVSLLIAILVWLLIHHATKKD